MFEQLPMAPPDAILGLTEAYKKDSNPQKINLGVGVYQDESGATPILTSVKKAEELLLKQEQTKTYMPIQGPAEYGEAVQQLLFGAAGIEKGRAQTAQTPGGTGALRVAGDFLKSANPQATIWMSDPTWANHKGVFGAAGLACKSYPYYNAETKSLDLEKMLEAIAAMPEGDIILLHGSCHNPTGMDPAPEQWDRIAKAVWARNLVPVIDFAYQGLAEGIDKDAYSVRLFAQSGHEALVCSSFSKNFGLYCERVGALTVVGTDADSTEKAFSNVKIAIRQNYSNPPRHGGAIVTTVLSDAALRAEWEGEVAAIRERIRQMRELFVETLKAKGIQRDFSFITRQHGMFSFSGLSDAQVTALRETYGIYMVGGGRMNVAGMTRSNMDRLCQAIAEVLGA